MKQVTRQEKHSQCTKHRDLQTETPTVLLCALVPEYNREMAIMTGKRGRCSEIEFANISRGPDYCPVWYIYIDTIQQ